MSSIMLANVSYWCTFSALKEQLSSNIPVEEDEDAKGPFRFPENGPHGVVCWVAARAVQLIKLLYDNNFVSNDFIHNFWKRRTCTIYIPFHAALLTYRIHTPTQLKSEGGVLFGVQKTALVRLWNRWGSHFVHKKLTKSSLLWVRFGFSNYYNY